MNGKKIVNCNRPSRFAERMLRIILRRDDFLERCGDLEEAYSGLIEEIGPFRGKMWYWSQVLKAVPVCIFHAFCWRVIMWKNYLKMSFRTIRKYRGFSLINISGLAVGIACSILVFIYVYDEWRYDRFHVNAHRIYRIISNGLFIDYPIHQTGTPYILAKTLRDEYPDDLSVTQYRNYSGTVSIENQNFIHERILMADLYFFRVFTFPEIHGQVRSVMDEPFTVVLTRSAAKKYFGQTDIMGKTIKIRNQDFSVRAVIDDVPRNSHFTFDAVVSVKSVPYYQQRQGWLNNNFSTYISLNQDIPRQIIQQRLDALTEKNIQPMLSDMKNNWWKYQMEPLLDIHLKSDLNAPYGVNGKSEYVLIFSIVAFLILMIACVNYVNLTTAKSLNRAKEIGIRKVVGSSKGQLMKQFLTESILLCMIGTFLAIILVGLFLPLLRRIAGRHLVIHYFNNTYIMPGVILLSIILGLFSGLYSAFFLSAFKPVSVLKRTVKRWGGRSLLRNGLVIFQYSVSIFLMIATVVIYNQMNYIQNINLGFDKEQVMVVKNTRLLGTQTEAFKDALFSSPNILTVTGSSQLPGQNFSNWGIGIKENENLTLDFCVCDEHFLETMDIRLVEGRFFSSAFSTDTSAVVLNEEAVRMFGWEHPIGQEILLWNRISLRVIGVVRNFHYESLYSKIDKMGMILPSSEFKNRERYVSVRMRTDRVTETVNFARETWKEFAPDFPFEYAFLDDEFDRLYQSEARTKTLAVLFSCLAIFISSLGMFGLASFAAEQKTKEISIRKVLGATVSGLVTFFSKAFLTRVLWANIIAWPVAYFLMQKWLEDFAYRMALNGWMFLLSGLLAMVIALLTVMYQSIKTAMANPIDSLRYE